MTNDPLILQFMKLLKEDEARESEALATTKFDNLYVVGLHQGRLQGMRMAQAALEAAARELDSEE